MPRPAACQAVSRYLSSSRFSGRPCLADVPCTHSSLQRILFPSTNQNVLSSDVYRLELSLMFGEKPPPRFPSPNHPQTRNRSHSTDVLSTFILGSPRLCRCVRRMVFKCVPVYRLCGGVDVDCSVGGSHRFRSRFSAGFRR